MPFFKKERKGGGAPEGAKGGGIAGHNGSYIVDVNYKIPGAGESEGYDQVVTRRSGANK